MTTKLTMIPPSPLELHLEAIVDLQKGCYQGQEGIASVLKNPCGPPRALYQDLTRPGVRGGIPSPPEAGIAELRAR
jgi:hypothetical protein